MAAAIDDSTDGEAIAVREPDPAPRAVSASVAARKNDVRVAPWHSKKMVARMQAASSSTSPILLVTTADAGHGIGSAVDVIVAQNVDAFSFLLSSLGASYAPPAPTPPPTK